MLKKLTIIHIILVIIDLAIIPVVGFVSGFDSPSTFIATLCTLLLAYPIIYLVMMLFKEGLILEYDTPRFMPLCMVLTIIFGCLIWYLFFHVEHVFSQTIGLWYGSCLMALAVPYIVMKILDKFSDKNKGPKIVQNK